VSAPRAATDARILSFPGGRRILDARDTARRLIERLPGLRPHRWGAADGWEDLSRTGRIEHLVMSEHIVDDDEFFRRRFHGEQIHLSREASVPGLSRATVLWDLTIAALGAPRLSAIGLALALRRRGMEEGSPPRFVVNGEREIDFGLVDGVREAIEHPPKTPDSTGHALPRELIHAVHAAISRGGELILLTSDPARAEVAARERKRLAAVFLVEERRMALLLPGHRGDWRLGGAVSAVATP